MIRITIPRELEVPLMILGGVMIAAIIGFFVYARTQNKGWQGIRGLAGWLLVGFLGLTIAYYYGRYGDPGLLYALCGVITVSGLAAIACFAGRPRAQGRLASLIAVAMLARVFVKPFSNVISLGIVVDLPMTHPFNLSAFAVVVIFVICAIAAFRVGRGGRPAAVPAVS